MSAGVLNSSDSMGKGKRRQSSGESEEHSHSERSERHNSEMSGGEEQVVQSDFASALSKLLKTGPVTEEPSEVVLSKRKAIERKLEEEKLEKRARRLVKADLAEKRDAAHQVPDMAQANYEKGLRKTAVRGVVQLFNAVHQHQQAKEKEREREKAAKEGKAAEAKPPTDSTLA